MPLSFKVGPNRNERLYECFVASLIGAFLWKLVFPSPLPRPYRYRSCQGRRWKNSFPDSSKEDIRIFLNTFTDAFAFSQEDKLKFAPEDTILQVYRALYPKRWMPDALEVETLAVDFESKYGVKFEGIWHEDLSLGELFSKSCGPTQP